MDQTRNAQPEKALKCGECGHTWKARTAQWCLGCGGKVIYEQAALRLEASSAAPE
jgi:hypothetical protein